MRQKINEDIQDSNSDPEHTNLINIYRALHFKYTKAQNKGMEEDLPS